MPSPPHVSPSYESCPLQNALLAAGLREKYRTENGGHGCRRLYGWDGMDASLVAIGTRAGRQE